MTDPWGGRDWSRVNCHRFGSLIIATIDGLIAAVAVADRRETLVVEIRGRQRAADVKRRRDRQRFQSKRRARARSERRAAKAAQEAA